MDIENEPESAGQISELLETLVDDIYLQRHGPVRLWIRKNIADVLVAVIDPYTTLMWRWFYRWFLRDIHYYCDSWKEYLLYLCKELQKKLKVKRDNRLLREMCCGTPKTTNKFLKLLRRAPTFTAGKRRQRSSSSDGGPNGTIFATLPPDIRRMILIEAFGNQTIHMDLRLRQPYCVLTDIGFEIRTHWNIGHGHAKIFLAHRSTTDVVDKFKETSWHWFSCVCHRYIPENPSLSLGRRENNPHDHRIDLDEDPCLRGHAMCDKWPGFWPTKCFIGIHGWLLSCRQAYIEGREILYRENTISISAPILTAGIHYIMSPDRLSMMTSIEILLERPEVDLEQAFTCLPSRFGVKPIPHQKGKVIFPSLRFARISFRKRELGEDIWVGERNVDHNTTIARNRTFSQRTVLALDSMIQRIAPPSADVTVSCPEMTGYNRVKESIVAMQGGGSVESRPSNLGGFKFWREMPKEEDEGEDSQRNTENEVFNGTSRGYWIHTSHTVKHLLDY